MPVSGGGLKVRSVVLLAPSAYLASAASTAELTPSRPLARLRVVEDSRTAIALTTWMRQASVRHHRHRSQKLRELGTTSSAIYEP